jgi:hypothetical protein
MTAPANRREGERQKCRVGETDILSASPSSTKLAAAGFSARND